MTAQITLLSYRRRWVIKKCNTQLSSVEKKKEQTQKEKVTLKMEAAKRIIGRGNIPSTVVVITTEG